MSEEYDEALNTVLGAARRLATLLDENDQVMQGKLISEAVEIVDAAEKERRRNE